MNKWRQVEVKNFTPFVKVKLREKWALNVSLLQLARFALAAQNQPSG